MCTHTWPVKDFWFWTGLAYECVIENGFNNSVTVFSLWIRINEFFLFLSFLVSFHLFCLSSFLSFHVYLQLTYLPPPWGDCRAEPIDSDFFTTYSITGCRIDCETRYLVENCNCRMVHMPGEDFYLSLLKSLLDSRQIWEVEVTKFSWLKWRWWKCMWMEK